MFFLLCHLHFSQNHELCYPRLIPPPCPPPPRGIRCNDRLWIIIQFTLSIVIILPEWWWMCGFRIPPHFSPKGSGSRSTKKSHFAIFHLGGFLPHKNRTHYLDPFRTGAKQKRTDRLPLPFRSTRTFINRETFKFHSREFFRGSEAKS